MLTDFRLPWKESLAFFKMESKELIGEKQGEGRDRGINLFLLIVISKKDKLYLYSSGVIK